MFDAPTDALPTPLQQTEAYARAVRLIGGKATVLELSGGHAVMQVRRLPVIGQVGLISRGPYWTEECCPGDLVEALSKRQHTVLINAEDEEGMSAAGFLKVISPATIAQLSLGENLFGRMHQKWRNRLRKAEESPLNVVRTVFPNDPQHWLLQAEANQRRNRGYRGLHPAFAVAFTKANPKMAQLFVANLGNAPVAGMLFLRHGDMATYHMGHTMQAGRALNAHTLILARAAKWFAGKGVRVLDLGSIDTVNAPGLARFKLGSGANPRVLGGTWLYSRRLLKPARALQVQIPSAAARMARMFSP